MWDGGSYKDYTSDVSDVRLRAMNKYIRANRKRNDEEALLEILPLVERNRLLAYYLDDNLLLLGVSRK